MGVLFVRTTEVHHARKGIHIPSTLSKTLSIINVQKLPKFQHQYETNAPFRVPWSNCVWEVSLVVGFMGGKERRKKNIWVKIGNENGRPSFAIKGEPPQKWNCFFLSWVEAWWVKRNKPNRENEWMEYEKLRWTECEKMRWKWWEAW